MPPAYLNLIFAGGLAGGDFAAWPDPVESLAVTLARVLNVAQSAPALAELVEAFQKNEKTLHLIGRQSLSENAPEPRLVILVDQFEEVFTLCDKDELREAFIRNLLYAAKVTQGQTFVILTMRADFYGKCAANVELAAALSDHNISSFPAQRSRNAARRNTLLRSYTHHRNIIAMQTEKPFFTIKKRERVGPTPRAQILWTIRHNYYAQRLNKRNSIHVTVPRPH